MLESPQHGPQLCTSLSQSFPPQGRGPDVIGWDWDKVEAESAAGTTWGVYELVGTFDHVCFTLTEPATPATRTARPEERGRATTPCPEPEGGWRPLDRSKATEEAAERAKRRARSVEEFAGGWIDQSYLGAYDLESGDYRLERLANDPARYVLNFAFTGDLTGREEWIREVWGGALCITSAQHTERELRRIVDELAKRGGNFLGAGTDVMANQVALTVYVASDELQADSTRSTATESCACAACSNR